MCIFLLIFFICNNFKFHFFYCQENIKNLREHQELSQKKLCNRLGLPASSYYRYESGEPQPNPDVLKLIANFFDVSVDYLLDNQLKGTPKISCHAQNFI